MLPHVLSLASVENFWVDKCGTTSLKGTLFEQSIYFYGKIVINIVETWTHKNGGKVWKGFQVWFEV